MKVLLALGADKEAQAAGQGGSRPLHVAAFAGHLAVVIALVQVQDAFSDASMMPNESNLATSLVQAMCV